MFACWIIFLISFLGRNMCQSLLELVYLWCNNFCRDFLGDFLFFSFCYRCRAICFVLLLFSSSLPSSLSLSLSPVHLFLSWRCSSLSSLILPLSPVRPSPPPPPGPPITDSKHNQNRPFSWAVSRFLFFGPNLVCDS